MTVQTLTIGKRRFVLVPESDFRKLQRRAASEELRPEFAEEAMKELRAYRKTGKARRWDQVKRKLGL
jgi:PHD/YefM family antitoxin component YafN of YafNO toxin-antitoxin module